MSGNGILILGSDEVGTLLEERTPERVGLVGTGVINLEIARFLSAALPEVRRFLLFDLDAACAGRFAASLREIQGEVEVATAASVDELLAASPLVSFATTALRPYVADLSACVPGAVLLHVSLRDLTPEAILACDNVVDDPDHVCRAQTAVHLAEQATGGRDFIRCTLADILQGAARRRLDRRLQPLRPACSTSLSALWSLDGPGRPAAAPSSPLSARSGRNRLKDLKNRDFLGLKDFTRRTARPGGSRPATSSGRTPGPCSWTACP
jgi:hypothetical protein